MFDLRSRDHLHDPDRKRVFNERHFAEAASRYDIATRAMSLGRDSAWKRSLVAALPDRPSPACLDLACGTGDVASLLADRYPDGDIVGLDISEPMLAIARTRERRANVRFLRADMGATGFPDDRFDVVTGSYALRNAPDLARAVGEIRRVLKSGGVAAFLDFAKPEAPLLRAPRYWLLSAWCGFWGMALHRNAEIHGGCIAESLKTFPDRGQLGRLFSENGFDTVSSRRFFLGLLELWVLRKRRERLGREPESAAGS